MSAHTPGPWFVHNKRKITTNNGHIVANAVISGNQNYESNASLIAAAPELLEALQVFMKKYDESPDGLLGVNLVNGDFDKARAAISKATGQ